MTDPKDLIEEAVAIAAGFSSDRPVQHVVDDLQLALRSTLSAIPDLIAEAEARGMERQKEAGALFIEAFAAECRQNAIYGNADPVEAEVLDERLTELAHRMRMLPDNLWPKPEPFAIRTAKGE